MALGKTVKALRTARGWTLKDLSKRSGVPVGTIGAIEVRDSVRSEYASKLAHGFGVSVDDLLSNGGESVIVQKIEQNQPLALIDSAQAATNNIATLEQSLEGLAHYLADLNESDRADVMRSIAVLEKEPERHAKQAAGIRAMVGAAFVPSVRKAA